jgi:hypothetical protein
MKSDVLIPVHLLCDKCQFHRVFWLKSHDEKLVCRCGNTVWHGSLDPCYNHYFFYIFDLLKRNDFDELIAFYYAEGHVLTREVLRQEINAFIAQQEIRQLHNADYEKAYSLIMRLFEVSAPINPIESDLVKICDQRVFINYLKLHSPKMDTDKLFKILGQQSLPLSIDQLEEIKVKVADSCYKDDAQGFIL